MTFDAQSPPMEIFAGSFTRQEPIPDAAVEAALHVLRHGRLHRYCSEPGEISETALLEEDFARLTGARYCLAVASGGYALGCALRAVGVGQGDRVLTGAFTLAPVPGAIVAVGAEPVFVETTEDLTLDLDDLAAKISSSGATTLLLSHTRGHLCDMDRLTEICTENGVTLIEDCAHSMGARFRGVPSGRHGRIACFSTQSHKHANSGEGGLIISDDADVMARAILLSGSYMHFESHRAAPPVETFDAMRFDTPNISGRMDNLRAAVLRPQLALLDERSERWAALYRAMEDGLRGTPGLRLIARHQDGHFVGSTFQFVLPGWSSLRIQALVAHCAHRGVALKWLGAPEPHGSTARHDHWRFAEHASLPRTDAILAGLIDMRLPLPFTVEDCALIARIVREEVGSVGPGQ